MRSRIELHLIGLFVLTGALLACSLSNSAPANSSPGIPILASPIRLVIPDGLASSAIVNNIDVITDQTGAAWDVAPAHLQITLQGYALANSFQVPQVFVYPPAEYAAMNQSAAESLKRLRSFLANPDNQTSNDVLPTVPFYNAGQVFAAQVQVIHFSGGSGVGFVTQYGQDISPINNGGLFFLFEGLSDDGNVYIVATLPLNLPFLAADNNPDSPLPSNGIPFTSASSSGAAYADYIKAVTDRINTAAAHEFNPSLNTLDQLIKSIRIGN